METTIILAIAGEFSSTDFSLWGLVLTRTTTRRLNRLRKKGPTPFCHSERSEESLFLFMELNRREILRFAQNDKINYFFRSLFSLRGFASRQIRKPQASSGMPGFRNLKSPDNRYLTAGI